nr:hypothetical protein [uncultured Flavobacterium sp.]
MTNVMCFFIIKEDKCASLAPIEVKILLYWGSVQEIATESGTILYENTYSFCSGN